jgi:solute:Na+ symporter, SSS family
LSVATAYIVLLYNNLMDYLVLIFSFFNAPLYAVFLLGMFTKWATPAAGFWGLLFGVIAASAHSFAVRSGTITYGSALLGDFYGAIYGWSTAIAVTCIVSLFTARKPAQSLREITYFTGSVPRQRISVGTWALVIVICGACIALNFIFR